MKNITFIIFITCCLLAIVLLSCAVNPEEETKKTHYVLQVNYISHSGQIPPTDTLEIDSQEEPHLMVDEGTCVLVGDSWARPIASYVRSFKIISKTP